ncbi:MAG: chemotaxis protein CheR [Candidatus Cloacimonetes bacterium HGW-Cloacimonetes-1]|jgi:two-component system CheB/CheR fusion protein|nr:MAG: chemotaxis protein CheR [Candidatus Cloacimonetes bacterium HGW-Cloacimonetes-1]
MKSSKPKPSRTSGNTSENSLPEDPKSPAGTFPIIGIGASAGGLATFEAFFSAIPPSVDCGMAFVIVQHLSPDHKSLLCELIQRYTTMQVHEITDNIEIFPDHAYIIPPSKNISLNDGKLQLSDIGTERGHRNPIDFFFRSLAADQQEGAICIILSGTGSDGTLGARAIKGAGGLVFAQSPETAEFDGMPHSVISAKLADFILPPAKMPGQLISMIDKIQSGFTIHTRINLDGSETILAKILNKVRNYTGHDFSEYKINTILRRIERRMVINHTSSLSGYLSLLQDDTAEVSALYADFLIGVTSFFRDHEAFDYLQEHILNLVIGDKPLGSQIRIWVPACSTGEEAYSLAILLYEYIQNRGMDYRFQIFATDIDRTAVNSARIGVYPENIAIDITPHRLHSFFSFTPEKHQYKVKKNIRDLIVFSEHNLLKDPPFSKIDLISCRNLLIYLNNTLQNEVISTFHYALNPHGILFLGTAETTGSKSDLFTPLQKKLRFYQRTDDPKGHQHPPMKPYNQRSFESNPAAITAPTPEKTWSLSALAEAELMKLYAPAAVIVNSTWDALYFHGRTGKYLEPSPGEARSKIIDMAREGLEKNLINAIQRASVSKTTVSYPATRVKTNGDYTTINLIVCPLSGDHKLNAKTDDDLYLVIFEELAADVADPKQSKPTNQSIKANAKLLQSIATLKTELAAKDEYLQSTFEEMATTTEEMKSTNEELQSVNEELQSANEELETSREELQSVNEELSTVNAELQDRIQYLTKIENDLSNLMYSTGIGTVFLDVHQLIKRYTPPATNVIKLRKSDLGRPIGDIVTYLQDYDCLSEDIQNVLNSLIPVEKEIQTKDQSWYLLRIIPYRTLDNVIDGTVVNFIDITTTKNAQTIINQFATLKRLTAVVLDANDAIMMLNMDGQILAWNPAATRMYGYSEDEALTMNVYALIPDDQKEQMRNTLNNAGNIPVQQYIINRICRDGGIVDVLVTTTRLLNADGVPYAIATTEHLAAPNLNKQPIL